MGIRSVIEPVQSPYPRPEMREYPVNSIAGLPLILRSGIWVFEFGVSVAFIAYVYLLSTGELILTTNVSALLFEIAVLTFPALLLGRLRRRKWAYFLGAVYAFLTVADIAYQVWPALFRPSDRPDGMVLTALAAISCIAVLAFAGYTRVLLAFRGLAQA